jgi:hypothetical protein
VQQWSAVHEDVGMEEDTGERSEERVGEGIVPGGMELGVKGEVEVIGIC